MENNKKEGNQTKELTREQLMDILNQMSEQDRNLVNENNRLKKVLTEMNLSNLFKRLDYLFMIVNADKSVFGDEFRNKCIKDIKDIMFQDYETETLAKE